MSPEFTENTNMCIVMTDTAPCDATLWVPWAQITSGILQHPTNITEVFQYKIDTFRETWCCLESARSFVQVVNGKNEKFYFNFNFSLNVAVLRRFHQDMQFSGLTHDIMRHIALEIESGSRDMNPAQDLQREKEAHNGLGKCKR